jgi:hypothetical protein
MRAHSPSRDHVSEDSGVLDLSSHGDSQWEIHMSLDRAEHIFGRTLRDSLRFCVRHVLAEWNPGLRRD